MAAALETTVVLGLQATLEFDAPEGRPTSAPTVAVYAPDVATDDSSQPINGAGQSATQDTVSTTLASAAGASQTNPRAVSLTSGSGVYRGRQYVMENVATQREWVRVESVSSGSVVLSQALVNDYAQTTGTFKSALSTYQLPSSLFTSGGWLADEANLGGPYGVLWTYTVSIAGVSTTFKRWTYFQLVRRRAASGLLTVEGLARYLPDVADDEWAQQKGQRFLPQLELAEQQVRTRIRLAGHDPDKLRGGTALLEEMGYLRAMINIGRAGGLTSVPSLNARLEEWKNDLNELLGQFSAGRVPVAADVDDSDALDDEELAQDSLGLVR